MITPSYSATATERVLPRLALDFTTASLDARVTVTRALNTATRVNSSGYIETVNANLPRFDFSPTSIGTCRGLLIEESRANLLTYSSQFDVGAWSKNNLTISTDAITAPDGTLSAYKMVEAATTSAHYIISNGPNFSAVSGTSYTYSCYFRKGGRSWAVIEMNGAPLSCYAFFDLTNEVVGTKVGNPSDTSITAVGNDWYRCTISKTAVSSGTIYFVAYTADGNNVISYPGDITKGIYVYGAQVEAGAFATSYIPTTTTSLTRNADEVRMTGTNFSSWYNASEGAFLVQSTLFSGVYPNNANLISVVDTTLTDTLRFWVWSGAANNLRWTETEGGAQQFDLTRTYTANTSFKAVAVYKANSFAFALNGGAITSTASGLVITSADGLIIGSKTGFTEFMSGHIAKVMYWPQRITNAEIQAFSK